MARLKKSLVGQIMSKLEDLHLRKAFFFAVHYTSASTMLKMFL